MTGHGIGHPRQPNPFHVVVSHASLLFNPPCGCGRPIVVPRQGTGVPGSARLECPRCTMCWQVDLRVHRDAGLTATWVKTGRL